MITRLKGYHHRLLLFSDGAYPVKLDFPGLGSVAQLLLDRGYVHSTLLPARTKVFEAEETISTAAFVTYVVCPTKFWIQLRPDEVNLVTEEIEVVTAQLDDLPPLDTLTPGSSCLALFPDDSCWYRATIDTVDGESVKVLYIDYGNSSLVDRTRLRKLPDSLRQYPALAIMCSLEGVGNLVGVDKLFQNLVLDLTFTVKFVQLVADCVYVRLYHADGIDLIQTLTLTSESELEEKQPEPEEKEMDVVEDQPQLEKEEVPVIEKRLQLENSPELSEVEVQPKLVVSEPSNPSTTKKVYITLLESPERFWILLEADGDYVVDIDDDILTLKRRKVSSIAVGDMVLARHTEFNEWYRTKIVGLPENRVRVLFVDYGGYLVVDVADICECPKVFRRIPCMAIECSMNSSILNALTPENVTQLQVKFNFVKSF